MGKTDQPDVQHDPQEGGCFLRNADGTLTKTEGTADAAPAAEAEDEDEGE